MPTNMTLRIPDDFWYHVSTFIPHRQLEDLYSVNRALFNTAMNTKYRRVEFANFDDEKMYLLKRLADPYVSRRVRSLHLDTWSVFTSHHRRGHTIYSSEEIIRAMTDAVHGMTGLTDFSLHWRNHLFAADLLPFLATAWSTLRMPLRRLAVTAPLGRLQTILATCFGFERLWELSISLEPDNFAGSAIAEARVLTQVVAPLVNALTPHLRHLCIASRSLSADVSPLLWALVRFPLLHSSCIFIPYENCGMDDDGSLAFFLRRQSGVLRFFELAPLPPPRAAQSIEATTTESVLQTWLTRHQKDKEILDGLEMLRMYLPPGCFETSLAHLTRSVDTLRTLTLDGQYLEFEQVDSLVTVFKGYGLRTLRLSAESLSPRLVARLARLGPCLEDLQLLVQAVADEHDEVQTDLPTQNVTHCLSRLTVKGINLEWDNAYLFLQLFHHYFHDCRITSLGIDLHTLSPLVVDGLAKELPDLTSLRLNVQNIVGDAIITTPPLPDFRSTTSKLEEFRRGMCGKRYEAWPLEEAYVTSTSLTLSAVGEVPVEGVYPGIVEVLATCIPRLKPEV
ncbi:hypothetical protein HGRIS_011020 [Hohenbuehelia grisea]|uniref:F-box domain-containing protein n=1 Tax=Hohenbuehelia grisea TaxID=104357 RepID=A0ABR3IYL9_9AGAR